MTGVLWKGRGHAFKDPKGEMGGGGGRKILKLLLREEVSLRTPSLFQFQSITFSLSVFSSINWSLWFCANFAKIPRL